MEKLFLFLLNFHLRFGLKLFGLLILSEIGVAPDPRHRFRH